MLCEADYFFSGLCPDKRMRVKGYAFDTHTSFHTFPSGYGGIYPKGQLVGIVKSVDRSGQNLFQTIYVEPAVDFSRLEEVLVLLEQPISP